MILLKGKRQVIAAGPSSCGQCGRKRMGAGVSPVDAVVFKENGGLMSMLLGPQSSNHIF